jgi:hypothetical protein
MERLLETWQPIFMKNKLRTKTYSKRANLSISFLLGPTRLSQVRPARQCRPHEFLKNRWDLGNITIWFDDAGRRRQAGAKPSI